MKRRCITCERILLRRKGEKPSTFKTRKTCEACIAERCGARNAKYEPAYTTAIHVGPAANQRANRKSLAFSGWLKRRKA